MARREIPIGRTGSAEYLLSGAWVYRRTPSLTQRYDTLEGFVTEMLTGALGAPGAKPTKAGASSTALSPDPTARRRRCCQHPRLRLNTGVLLKCEPKRTAKLIPPGW